MFKPTLLVLAAMSLTQVQSLLSYSHFTQEAHRLQQATASSGIEPIVGDSLISVVLTDIINIFISPSWSSFLAVFVDLSAFFTMPLLGGYVNSTVYSNYITDPLTY
jgi:hypothetical protein